MKTCRPEGRYLEHTAEVRVRFQEVDALGVVWHGHYLSFFEDGRAAFGKAFGIGYEEILEAGLVAPVVQVACEYFHPAHYNETLQVHVRLFQRDTAKLEFHYEVVRPGTLQLCARGYTVQAFLDQERELVVTLPALMRSFYTRWEERMGRSDG